MKINRNNYEVYFLDYIEGKLSASQTADLHAFLLLHSDLAAELDELQNQMNFAAPDASIVFLAKSTLRKAELPIPENELNELFAREVEGTLTSDEHTLLEQIISEFPHTQKVRNQFQKTKLKPVPVHFEHKSRIAIPSEIDLIDDEMQLIALMEGDLDQKQSRTLLDRIAQDHRLSLLYNELKKCRLHASDVVFESKHSLQFSAEIDLNDPQFALVALMEGDLHPTQKVALQKQLNTLESYRLEYAKTLKTKLIAPEVLFEGKALLKKKVGVIIPLQTKLVRLTAVAAIFVAAILIVQRQQNHSEASLASNFEHKPSLIRPHDQQAERHGEKSGVQERIYQEPAIEIELKSVPFIDSIQNTPQNNRAPLPGRLQSIEVQNVPGGELASIKPDVSHLPQGIQHAELNHVTPSNESVTLLSYIGQAATEKIENTLAFTFAERKVEQIALHTREEVGISRQEGIEKDRVTFRIGTFQVQTDAPKKRSKKETVFTRLHRYYKSMLTQ